MWKHYSLLTTVNDCHPHSYIPLFPIMILIRAAVLPCMYLSPGCQWWSPEGWLIMILTLVVINDGYQWWSSPPQGGGAPSAGWRLHTFQGSLFTLSDKKCCQRGGAAPRDDACFLVDPKSDIIFHTLLWEYLIHAFHRSRCQVEVEARLQDLERKRDKGWIRHFARIFKVYSH